MGSMKADDIPAVVPKMKATKFSISEYVHKQEAPEKSSDQPTETASYHNKTRSQSFLTNQQNMTRVVPIIKNQKRKQETKQQMSSIPNKVLFEFSHSTKRKIKEKQTLSKQIGSLLTPEDNMTIQDIERDPKMLKMCHEISLCMKFKDREKQKKEGILPEELTRLHISDSFHSMDSNER